MSELLADADTPASAIEAALLVVNELATNALTHGAPAGQARLHLIPGQLRLDIDDHNHTSLRTDHTAHPHQSGPGRFGLHLVDQLARSWGTIPTPTGKTVWAEIDLNPPTEV